MAFLWNAASLIVLLGIVVTVHEGGHFFIARWAGIKVLKFSIGFGKPLFSWFGKDGVEYVIAAIPLGGYVKMLDEREGDVSEHDLDRAFNQASVSKRIAVVAAGPIANFILAILLFWAGFMLGVPGIKPVIGEVVVGGVGEQAGLRQGQLITAVGDEPVKTWSQVGLSLANYLGEAGNISMQVQDKEKSMPYSVTLKLKHKIGEIEGESPLETLGITVYLPEISNQISQVADSTPAFRAGLQAGDKIIQLDEHKITSWSDLLSALKQKANQSVELTVERRSQLIDLKVHLGLAEGSTEQMGFLGVTPTRDEHYHQEIQNLRVNVQYGFIEAFVKALDKTGKFFSLSITSVRKMLSRDVSHKNLSGPVGIAESAGSSANAGLSHFLLFMGMISVSIGFLNLLPIPVLDGGHLLFYCLELIRGKPVPESIQEFGMKLGLILILSLMVLALFNDFSRLGF